MPAGTNRSRRKHQTAQMQRLTAIPAAVPVMTSTSLFARRKPTKTPETIGAQFAPRFQIRNEPRMRLPTVSTIQSICAGPHGSNAKGTVKQNAVGRYTYRVTTWRTVAVSDERSTPRLIDAQHLTFLVWVS